MQARHDEDAIAQRRIMTDPIAHALATARTLLGQGHGEAAGALLRPICDPAAPAEAWFLLGAAEHLCGRLAAALTAFDRAVHADARHVQAANARAAVLSLLGRTSEALAEYRRAHALNPRDARIVVNIAIVLEQSGDLARALQHYDAALALDASSFPALLNRSALLLRLGRPEQALADAERAAAVDPAACDAHFNRAQALAALDRYEESLTACGRIIEREPRHVGAHFHRSLALACLGQFTEARAGFVHARTLDPALFGAIVRAASEAQPHPPSAPGRENPDVADPRVIYIARGVGRLARCDWSGRDEFLRRLSHIVREGMRTSDPVCERSLPFASLFLPLEPDVARGIASGVARAVAAAAPRRLPSPPPRARDGALRVGYLSVGFRRHPSAFLNAPILHAFDRARVCSFGYVLNPPDGSAEAQWLAAGFDRLRNAASLDDESLARLIRDDAIDILVDEAHGYDGSRPQVMAARPAPITVCHYGALVPSGGDWVDYRIVGSDDPADAADDAEFAPECIVRLPRACWTYATGPLAVAPTPDRSEVGLPPTGTVLCAFSGSYKIDPALFECWLRVLRRAPESVLWLLGDATVERNLRAHAKVHGVDASRIVFARRTGLEQHLGRLKLADLFLDTLPCNAHTTALEALHCGVPVLTLMGQTAAGRVGANIVRALGLSELACGNLDAYEARAVELALDAAQRTRIKTQLRTAGASAALWDGADLARCLERAFEMMWARYQSGLPPAPLQVPHP